MMVMRIRKFVGGLVLSGGLTVMGSCQSTPNDSVPVANNVDVAQNDEAAFAVGVIPTLAPPIRIGASVGFRLTSGLAGLGHLYLIGANGDVTVLTENLPLGAGSQVEFPNPAQGFMVTAEAPGVNRVILLVTLEPFVGFANTQGAQLPSPVSLTLEAGEFLRRLNDAAEELPATSWATNETRVQVVG